MMRRLGIILVGLVAIAAVGAGVYFSVRAVYGAFDDAYYLSVDLDKAGQQLQLGSDVRVKGVEVGKVADIRLVDGRARVEMKIDRKYKIPRDAAAVISLKTPLGAKYVDLQFPGGSSGPFLSDGDSIQTGHVGPELEDLLDDGVRVFDAIPPDDLATVITELSDAARGHGDDIARSLRVNSELSELFASTLEPQLQGIEDFDTIFGALESKGVDLNRLAEAINEGAPVYASAGAQRNLRRALEALLPFSDNLADLLIYNNKDLDRMYNEGDKVLATIAARPRGLHNLVHGLYRYVYKLGQDIPPDFMLADGSAGAGFVNFMGGNDQAEEQKQICGAFPRDLVDLVPICAEQAAP